MKIRSGYVSNSSSSSYIIGIGLIKPEFEDDVKNISNYAVQINTGNDQIETNESFDGNSISMTIPSGRKFVTIYDCYDVETNEDGEPIEDDIDFNQFNKSIQKVLDFQNTWFEKFDYQTGTGYNG